MKIATAILSTPMTVSPAPLLDRRPSRVAPEALAERVANEMSSSWSRGEQTSTEDFLARHPEIRDDPPAAARIIYEEYCLREGLGQQPDSAELIGRFPQWREQIRILLDCHDLIRPRTPLPCPFGAGDVLGEYTIHSLLGQGRRGTVFLATQRNLADRPVVLKLTRRLTGGQEHLALARLPHPHIVPLYAVHDFADLDLRALCMPFLGETTLDRLLDRLEGCHPAERSGTLVLRKLDEARHELAVCCDGSKSRRAISRATYPGTVAEIGASLADALHFAHTRGLLHLDIKPSNILITDEGQPMLLDFHLSQSSIAPRLARPERIGGTFGYMAPEHEAVMDAVLQGRVIPDAVDARADIYALGVTLYEALAGTPPPGAGVAASVLLRTNPRVGAALAAIVVKCMSREPRSRYQSAAELADALRHPRLAVIKGLRRVLGLRGR